MSIILASQSPRRRELMGLFRIPFTVKAADIDETMTPGLAPDQAVGDVSRRKALSVSREETDTVIAADTIVVAEGAILGKPRDAADAARMLRLLSGKTHQVMTGLTVARGEKILSCTEITDVTFRSLCDTEIEDYIRTGEPMDKAGAYGIQGGAALFVQSIRGDYYNVVGLPVCRLATILREMSTEEIS